MATLVCAFGEDNKIALGQQFVSHFDSRLERAAPIAAQIQHQLLHAFSLQLQQSGMEFGSGAFGKALHLHIARGLV